VYNLCAVFERIFFLFDLLDFFELVPIVFVVIVYFNF